MQNESAVPKDLKFEDDDLDNLSNNKSDEEGPFQYDEKAFQQIHFYQLFQKNLDLQDVPLNENDISPETYLKMREYNRNNLTQFFENLIQDPEFIKETNDEQNGPDIVIFKLKNNSEPVMTDEILDYNYKLLLKCQKYGKYLSPEIVAHLEYFINTLNFSLKNKTENPFQNEQNYPALHYKDESKNSQSVDDQFIGDIQINENLEDQDDLIDLVEIKSQYEEMNSMKNQSISKISNFSKKQVTNEIKRQSVIFLQNLTLLEKSNLLIKPFLSLKKVKKQVQKDKKSILSLYSTIDCESRKSMIDNVSIQEEIVKKSLIILNSQYGSNVFNSKIDIPLMITSKLQSPPPKDILLGNQTQNQDFKEFLQIQKIKSQIDPQTGCEYPLNINGYSRLQQLTQEFENKIKFNEF